MSVNDSTAYREPELSREERVLFTHLQRLAGPIVQLRHIWGGPMSVTPTGEELPNKGKELPSAGSRRARDRDYAHAVADALKVDLARGVSIKTIMAWTGAGERTVKGWVSGSNGPSGQHLESLLRSSEPVYVRVMLRAGRRLAANRQSLEALRQQLAGATQAIDAVLVGSPPND